MPSAYLANANSNDVSVFDTTGFTVVGTVTVGTSPRGVAVTPDLSTVYVTNFTTGTVSVIDAATLTVTHTITVGNGPGGICVDAKGQVLLVTNFTDGTVSVIAIPANTVTGTVTLPTHFAGATTSPYSVCISPDSTTGYVATELQGSHSTGFVEVIDIAGLSVTTSISTGVSNSATTLTAIQGICIHPNGLHVFATGTASGTQSVISTASNTIVATMLDTTGQPHSICVLPDGSKGFWQNSVGDVYIFNPTSFAVTSHFTLSSGDFLTGIAPTSDSAFVFIADTGPPPSLGASTIFKINTTTLAGTSLTTGKSGADGIGLSLYSVVSEMIVMIV